MGLIRNAVKQGSLAASHALMTNRGLSGPVDTELLIVGAGPAGLAASLTAIEQGRRYICIDQNSFGGTVYNFPRQKVVMIHPAELPVVGKMKFKQNHVSKEELLEFWNDVRRRTRLQVHEKTSFESMKQVNGAFEVSTSRGLVRARRVVLAMGVRGTPRKLGLPNEDLPKVAYNLVDPEQYARRSIAIVGGGNSAAEAALALADPALGNRVLMLVRGPAMDRCNAENRAALEKLAAQRRIQVWFESSVKEIHPDRILAKSPQGEYNVPNEFLLVLAGAEMPHQFLMSLGIQIDKKFGEALRKAR
jgi:thioredoxin reductase